MHSMIARRSGRIVATLAGLLLGAAVSSFAQELKYEGDVFSVDSKAHTFTVHGTERVGVKEMTFQVGPGSEIIIDGERMVLAELVRGDHVVVSYDVSGTTHTAHRTERLRSTSREMTFKGEIVALDPKTEMFTVRTTVKGKAEEMMFHVSPSERLYFDGEEVPLKGLRKGDFVTVMYDERGPTHYAKEIKKAA